MNGAAPIDVATDLDDVFQHRFEIAGDGYLFDRSDDFAALD